MLDVGGRLMDFSHPCVMGILNVTPDSFYAGSCQWSVSAVARCVEQMVADGVDIIDVGACSTRPGSTLVSEEEELQRMRMAMEAVRRAAPEAVVSIDTFRSRVACEAVERFGVAIINDVSGGEADAGMFPMVARLGVPYVLTHNRAFSGESSSPGDLMTDVLQFFAAKVQRLHEMGVADILLDPGFGFGKTLEENYLLLRRLKDLQVLGLPLLVGVSRKSMVYNVLGVTPDEALDGTTALHAVALMHGASVLRAHDVRACRQVVTILNKLRGC
ncbi:MAG: dihydropteroate synthase [Bacteroidaceae bacterium]|nr:dihydropteroate synthase [Bacteroidaceae bacterium]